MTTDAIQVHRGRDRYSINAWFPLSGGSHAGKFLQINKYSPLRLGACINSRQGFIGIDFIASTETPLVDAGREKMRQYLESASSSITLVDAIRKDVSISSFEIETIGSRSMKRSAICDGWKLWTFPLSKCRIELEQTLQVQKAVSHYACYLNTRLYFGGLYFDDQQGWGLSMALPDESTEQQQEQMLYRFDQLGRTFMTSLWPNMLALYDDRLAREYLLRNGLMG